MSIAYCASPACVRIYLSGNEEAALERKEREIRGLLGPRVLPVGMNSPIELLLDELAQKGMTLAVAESCTGGMIGAAATEIPGASKVFKGGMIVYSNELKHQLLDVPLKLLEKFGAVSSECANTMAANLCDKLKTDAGIAVTGIAGPDGGTPEKPVGLIYAGLTFAGKTSVAKFNFPGPRSRIRERTLHAAINALLKRIRG